MVADSLIPPMGIGRPLSFPGEIEIEYEKRNAGKGKGIRIRRIRKIANFKSYGRRERDEL